jgi:hypothetical protein
VARGRGEIEHTANVERTGLNKFLRRVGTIENVADVANEIMLQSSLWGEETSRQERINVQRETKHIPLRTAVKGTKEHVNDSQRSVVSKYAWRFPKLMAVLDQASASLGGELSRAMIVSLPPKGVVHPHIDEGRYYAVRDRYHLVVICMDKGAIVNCGSEQVEMKEGDVWWIDNKSMHGTENRSPCDRVAVIFDLKRA